MQFDNTLDGSAVCLVYNLSFFCCSCMLYTYPTQIKYSDFNYDIPVENVEVKKDGSIYTLAETAITQIIDNKGETIESTGSLSGTITEGKIALNFNFKPGAMPMDIECTFEGKLSE